MLLLRRPDETWLRDLAERERSAQLTYGPVGVSAGDATPAGLHREHWEVCLGAGDARFATAAEALRRWTPQLGSGLALGATGPVAVGTVVAQAAPMPAGYVVATCRIVDVEDTPEHVTWTYGTLPIHPESGEERFAVVRRGEEVHFEIDVVAGLRHPLARLAPPVARLLQRRATQGYLEAMEAAVRGGGRPHPA